MEETLTPSPSPHPTPPTPPCPPGTNRWDVKHGTGSRQALEDRSLRLACLLFSASISSIKTVTLLPVCLPPFAHGWVKMLGKYCLSACCLAGGHAKGTLGACSVGRDGGEPVLGVRESLALGNRTGRICQIFSLV